MCIYRFLCHNETVFNGKQGFFLFLFLTLKHQNATGCFITTQTKQMLTYDSEGETEGSNKMYYSMSISETQCAYTALDLNDLFGHYTVLDTVTCYGLCVYLPCLIEIKNITRRRVDCCVSLAQICTHRKKIIKRIVKGSSKRPLKVLPSSLKLSLQESKKDLTVPRMPEKPFFFSECRILLLLLSMEETDIYSVFKCGHGVQNGF